MGIVGTTELNLRCFYTKVAESRSKLNGKVPARVICRLLISKNRFYTKEPTTRKSRGWWGAEFKLTLLSVTAQHPVKINFFAPLNKICGFLLHSEGCAVLTLVVLTLGKRGRLRRFFLVFDDESAISITHSVAVGLCYARRAIVMSRKHGREDA